MHVVTEYPNGMFCWVDLMTTDDEGMRAFYSGLFGWETDVQPIPMGGTYTNFTINGHRVAGGGKMSQEMIDSGMPPVWTSYIKHDDVDAMAAKISEAGGTVMMPAMDVMEEGRMLMFQDPTGAVSGVWQPKNHSGAALVNEPNTLVWNELNTRAPEESKAFYTQVFGWEAAPIPGDTYVTWNIDGRAQAGIMTMDENFGEMPNHWATYFRVEAINSMVEKGQSLGATILTGPMDAGGMGTFAVVQDPQGAVFTMMEFSGPVDPPPGA